eukprot:4502345-Ditylum_brightwellii.AAC.1
MRTSYKSELDVTCVPGLTLKNMSQYIVYHFVKEGSAKDECHTLYANSNDNDSDLLTKLLPDGERGNILQDVCCATSIMLMQLLLR